jgi:hypothetical protein
MKRLFLFLALAISLSAGAQQKKVMLPGKGKINVERLNKQVPMDIDVSQLSLSEVRVLRNAFAARQGYCFMSGDLRSIFGATSWYDQMMNDRFWKEEEGKAKPITYTEAEKAFMQKLKEREDALKKENYPTTGGQLVNINNLINPFQLESADDRLMQALAKNAFAIVPGNELQLFHVYERNDYHEFPNFVTTDLFLQVFHIYFDCLLKETEQQKFYPQLITFVKQLYDAMSTQASFATDPKVKAAAQYNTAYFAIAHALLTEEKPLPVSETYTALVKEEISHVKAAETTSSTFLGYVPERNMPMFIYNTYRPRGHYTRNETLKRYFRAMMWLQNAPFGTDMEDKLQAALLMAQVIGSNEKLSTSYRELTDPITYLMGTPDDVSIMQVYEEIQKSGMKLNELFKDKKKMAKIRGSIEALRAKQTRIKPKFQLSSEYKICLMPQRYMPDNEVLLEMVDYDSSQTKRDVPKGLDVLAALGIYPAERILLGELNEQGRWDGYTENLQKMKQRMTEIDWKACVANQWIAATKDINASNASYPKFMLTPQWEKKNLNSALASWAELKHDAILYGKQPMGAECGGGGPPDPVVRGYVEPNVAYWTKAIELIDATMDVLRRFNLVTEKAANATDDLRDKAEFLLNCSKKELAGKRLSDEEYGQIEVIGSSFEYSTLYLLQEPNQELAGWSDVEGADKSISVVADVYTANAGNNPNKSVLYEAVGPTHEIYVVVEIEGYLYLTRGAVFSYREFQEDIAAPRKTDEEWQQELETNPDKGIPDWMKEIIVPLNGKVLDNEHIFYSSGC